MKIAILSNVNLDMLVQNLSKEHEVFSPEGYGQWIPYSLEKKNDFFSFNPKIIYVIIDGNALLETFCDYQSGCSEIVKSLSYIASLSEIYGDALIAVSTIDIRKTRIHPVSDCNLESQWEHYWISELTDLIQKKRNLISFDLKSLIHEYGSNSFYSDKMWYMGSIPYSIKGIDALSSEIKNSCIRFSAGRKKVLVTDLDNTLWGGVIGEDGPEGIVLSESLIGAAYRDTQKRLKELKNTGILLAVVSKNNPEDADKAFTNPHMILQKEDFVTIIANWNSKAENIRTLAATLNLGLESFVFLDDNPVERESVKQAIPEITVIDFPKDVAKLPYVITSTYFNYFWCRELTEEDKEKTNQYKQESQRKQAQAAASSFEDYLKSLNITVKINEVEKEQIPRTVQLLNKTNQFNTNTVRYDEQEFMHYLSQNHVYVACVSDIYGDNGLVAEVLLRITGSTATIDNFLMSCRVMSRKIEHALIFALAQKLHAEGIKTMKASYIRTEKNKPVENVWDSLGFSLLTESEGIKNYECTLPLTNQSLIKVEWK